MPDPLEHHRAAWAADAAGGLTTLSLPEYVKEAKDRAEKARLADPNVEKKWEVPVEIELTEYWHGHVIANGKTAEDAARNVRESLYEGDTLELGKCWDSDTNAVRLDEGREPRALSA